ncbi:aminodeoxychorismate synthase component I [Aurantiacibacter gangjinensis]|uniref:Probable branched-chain-amino-acid aminotransferase n=1 Tax=Aurantiacibacter gangjinensis TaxID=502682 RepID=A0A0G9ML29_9SPHN|nr:aminodeoxychorismate synthase component I [Aurantiacibacter gangjinensis]APE27285.1 Para-aminobenzoate synthase, aminase component / Aminodeoxychorismate lyase [Aurantiacibacter gangjinensis]KLE31395.1 aminobenzoate synthetase [Aurantiacibacter gangjinensis]
MDGKSPFVLLDDARESGASDAQYFTGPSQVFVARRPGDVERVLAQAEAARSESGKHLAGYIAYEAGLALEERLQGLAAKRSGGDGPLVWLGLFDAPGTIPAADMPDWLAARAGGRASIGPLDPQISTGAYLDAFDRLQEAIRAGDIYQANLTFPLAGPARGHPAAIYAAIRPDAAAGYGGLIFDGSDWLLSFSPELFVSLKGKSARVKPMKGTRPRAADAAQDRAMAEELAHSAKDKAENLMIVDLMRNDLSRVAEPGSVQVEAPFAVESYPTVHQMVSTVHATLAEGKGAMDMVRALFPCGSITGTPKIRAMELIAEVERDPRGPYCGAIGRIDPNGHAAFNVAIRTIRLTPGENERHKAVLGVGGAIVADSDGMEEWRECLVKGAFVRGAAGGHDLIETMRFSAVDGMPLLELHLERMKESAAALGFAFDRHETRNRIQALCFELEKDAKLRLLLSRSGATSLEAHPMPDALTEPVRCIALPHPTVPHDWRLRHKSTDRHFYDDALSVARDAGTEEALLVREDGLLTEGCWTNIFIKRDDILLTPPLALGLLPGVLRRSLIEDGRAREAELRLEDLADGFFIGNALRGLLPAALI